MLKKIFAVIAMLYAAVCFAAVDVNKGTAAELDAVKGIGPAISGKILDERKKGPFKDWSDFIARVKGVGDKSAAKLSAEGLTVNGAAFAGAPAAPAKKDEKPAAKADAKAAPVAAPAAVKAEDKKPETKPAAAAVTPAPAKAADKAATPAKPEAATQKPAAASAPKAAASAAATKK